MNDFLDMRTLIFISGITSVFLCVCMLYVYMRLKTYDGFLHWTVASFLMAVGMVLVSQRNILPDFVTILVANMSLVLFIALIAYGLGLFAGLKPRGALFSYPLGLFLASVVYFTYAQPNVNVRMILFSGITALFSAAAALLTYRAVPRVLPARNWFLISFFTLNAAWMIMRAVMTVTSGDHPQDLMSAGPLHKMTVMISVEAAILGTIGLLMINAQRVAHELRIARGEIKVLKGFLPICAGCKKIRDDRGYWNQIESYLLKHADLEFSHSICPECEKRLYGESVEA